MVIDEYVKTISKTITKPIVVFDLETTGIDTNKDQTIQFAGIRINPDGTSEELTFICKPTIQIAEEATKVHGYSNDSLKDKPEFKTFVPKIMKLFKGADVAGFNIASFDIKVLIRQMTEHGKADVLKDAAVYDAYKVFMAHCTRKLGDACKFYLGQEIEDAHDALGDVKTTAAVIAKQVDKEQTTIVDIAQKTIGKTADKIVSDQYITYNDKSEPVLNFSKHKGTPVKDVDKGFIKWVISKDFPKSVKDILKPYQ
jgi:DNA polymerase-3 subunit epsilon